MARLTLDWIHLVILLGALQGVLLTVALATKRSNRTANRLLAAVMLAFSIYLATTVFNAAGLFERFPHSFGISYPLPFLFGPLIYLYARTAADRNRRLERRDSLHAVPFVATVLAGLPIYLMSAAGKRALYDHLTTGGAPPLLIAVADPLKLLSGVIYATATIVFLRRHRERVKQSYSTTEHVNLRWLLWLGVAAAAIWFLAVLVDLMLSAGLLRVGVGEDIISMAMAVLVYGIGYAGLRQPEIFRYETAEYPVPRPVSTPAPAFVEPELVESEQVVVAAPESAARYERSGLTDREAKRLKAALIDVMEREQPWKDSGLTLGDLGVRLGTTPHKLSEVLNSEIGQTFYDFVNGYRVREVQRRIAAGEARSLKMLSLAMDAGFASKSTFNQVFKKHTSQTPSDFRQAAGH
jgi:AraC-like DNA-binding protein/uncharacterized membrane protein YfcA